MREVALSHWSYYTWHLPASLLMLGSVFLAFAMGYALARSEYGHVGRALRFRVLGWSSLVAALTSAIVFPYLATAATITVDPDGTWRVCNYLGLPLARVPSSEVRELRAVDLGGLGWGTGHLEIRREDGSVIRSVRISRLMLDQVRHTLGYPDLVARSQGGDVVIDTHRYAPSGPWWDLR